MKALGQQLVQARSVQANLPDAAIAQVGITPPEAQSIAVRRKLQREAVAKKYEGTKSLRGKIPEATLEKIAELRQSNEQYDNTISWLREAQ